MTLLKKITSALAGFAFATCVYAQDGADYHYLRIGAIDNKLKGRFAQIDFYNCSVFGIVTDTVTIVIYTKPVLFREVRKDDGLKTSFAAQFLESVDSYDQVNVIIRKSRIDQVTSDSILVTNYIEYYRNGQWLYELSSQEQRWFPKKIIAGLLVYAEQPNPPRR